MDFFPIRARLHVTVGVTVWYFLVLVSDKHAGDVKFDQVIGKPFAG